MALLSLLVFMPRTYDVPPINGRAGTQYWELSTGSRIAYTLIPARSPKNIYPVIYLHGGPGGPIYDSNISMLAPLSTDGYDVYLYDQVGSGLSERLEQIEQYTAERHKSDLEEIIKQIGAEKVILIGQSWGAILASLYIADHPDKVDRVIFTSPGPMQPQLEGLQDTSPPDSLQLRKPLFTNAQANQKINNIRTRTTTFLARQFGIKLCSDREADQFQSYLSNEQNKSVVCDTSSVPTTEAGNGFYAHIMTLHSLSTLKDPRPALKKVVVPMLLMKGQCDNQKWSASKEYLDLFQHHQLVVVQNAGHSISIEQPEVYLKTIRDFLDLKSP
jgi:proline iminopeptidase